MLFPAYMLHFCILLTCDIDIDCLCEGSGRSEKKDKINVEGLVSTPPGLSLFAYCVAFLISPAYLTLSPP